MIKAKKSKDTLGLARCYRYYGGYFYKNNIYDSAYFYYCKSERFYKKTKDKSGLARVYLNKGVSLSTQDDYLGAELNEMKAYLFYKSTKDYQNIYGSLNALGNTFHNLKRYDDAINYFNKALKVVKNQKFYSKKESYIGTCLNNIGNAYREKKEYSKAIFNIENALKEKNLIKKDPGLYGILLNNLACCNLALKNYKDLPNSLYLAINLLKNDIDRKETIVSNIYLSNYYLAIKDSTKAIQYSEKALELAKESKAPYYVLTALSNAGQTNPKKASKYIKEYHQINDSILFKERIARNQFYKIELETNEITKEKDTQVRHKWILATIANCIIIILLLIFVIYRQRYKQKVATMLQSQQKANEEIYQLMLSEKTKVENARQEEKNRISLDLHDGILNKLAGIRVNLSLLHFKKDQETIQRSLPYIDNIQKVEQEIRAIAHDLGQSTYMETNSFNQLLIEFIAQQNELDMIQYTLNQELFLDWSSISSVVKMNVYRIFQEACHNINQHAKAKNVHIDIVYDDPNICFSIFDDGIGFDSSISYDGIGLKNIQVRVKNINGIMKINSENGKGTYLNFSIPNTI